MLKKSLLSAGLQGQPAAQPQQDAVDPSSFPCIAGRPAPATVDEVAASVDRMSLRRSLPGSAPTVAHGPGSLLVRGACGIGLWRYWGVGWPNARALGRRA